MENIIVHNIDVTNLSSEGYDGLMDAIRAQFVDRQEHSFRDVPVTTNEEGWLIISLNMPGCPSAQLLVNLKNGYLTAIRDGQEDWYCFGDLDRPDELNAEVIKHLESSYNSLVKWDNWAEVAVGPISVVEAYHTIVNFNNRLRQNHPRVDVQRKALVRLAVIFCEGTRLRTVRRLVSHQMDMLADAIIDPFTKKKITSWSLMSKFALHCWRRQQNGLAGFEDSEMAKLAACGITSIEQAVGDPDGELLLILLQ